MQRNIFDDESTSVHVMAFLCQATSHYLSNIDTDPCVPYGSTKTQ